MPPKKKYIKDGAYTIVVDVEEASHSSSRKSKKGKKGALASRSHSWQSVGSNKSNLSRKSKGDKVLTARGTVASAEDLSDDSSIGSSQAGDFEEEEECVFGEDVDDDNDLEVPPEEEEVEEEIDFTDTNYILQNLTIATPDYTQDNTFLLRSRADFVEMLCSQVRFYIYCAMHAFLGKPRTISILIIGEGFMGSHIIHDLASTGLRDYLHVFTRGDLTALEWRQIGIKAATTFPNLMGPQKADVVIFATENASFPTVCNQLNANKLLQPSTFVINCCFGLGRKKIFRNLSTPSLFRTYLEPQGIARGYKSKAYRSLQAFAQGGQDYLMSNLPYIMTTESEADSPRPTAASTTAAGITTTTAVADSQLLGDSSLLESTTAADQNSSSSRPGSAGVTSSAAATAALAIAQRHQSFAAMSVDSSMDPSQGERSAATFIAKRSVDIRMLICVLENYFALHDHSYAFSRRLALKCLLGFADEARAMTDDRYALHNSPLRHHHTLNMSEEAKQKKKRKYEAKLKNRYQNVIDSLTFSAETYQEHFFKTISRSDFLALAEEEFDDPLFTTEEEELAQLSAASTYSTPAAAVANSTVAATTTATATTTGGGSSGIGGSGSSSAVLSSAVGSPAHPHYKLKEQKKQKNKAKEWHHMYDDDALISIFGNDDNYSSYVGPGIDLMYSWDGFQRAKFDTSQRHSNVAKSPHYQQQHRQQQQQQQLRRELSDEETNDGFAHFVGQVSDVMNQSQRSSQKGTRTSAVGIDLHTGEVNKEHVDDRMGLELMQKYAAANAEFFHSRKSASKNAV